MTDLPDHLFTPKGELPIVKLEVKEAFAGLSDREKLYAHYVSRACWAGLPIVFEQVSVESATLRRLILSLFSADTATALRERAVALDNVSDDDVTDVLKYFALVVGNSSNYQSFGDTKILPRVSREVFRAIVSASSAKDEALGLFDSVVDAVYDTSVTELALDGKGSSNYYSPGMTSDEAKRVQLILEANGVGVENTRLFKLDDSQYELRVASANVPSEERQLKDDASGVVVKIRHGDYAEACAGIADNLERAIAHAANDRQRAMLEAYVRHFRGGSIDEHKESQRQWVKDVGPAVESQLGFVESYRDPIGVRAEFEGFVAVVDKVVSAKFGQLVGKAEDELLPLLPWPREFEKDTFLRPDFTSLEVLSFATSGIPAGINIPNYMDIRQDFGFKNVSLANVLRARKTGEPVDFLNKSDGDLFDKLISDAFAVQVGLHELLGHGSGKNLVEDSEGNLNFDKSLVNPLTGEPISSWYRNGATYSSVFGSFGSSFEECRAEVVGLYLCVNEAVLAIFGHEGDAAEDIVYINWLNMARAGLLGLQYYNPELKKWGQAHMQARFAILRVLLDVSDEFCTVERDNESGELLVRMKRELIRSHGLPAVEKFLMQIQLFKSTADANGASKLYVDKLTTPLPHHLDEWRREVMAKIKPRKVFVQSVTCLDESSNKIDLVEYEPTFDGILQWFVDVQA